ncbi:restriction endonuclease subunit S [Mitsuokella jalaludinii]|uniref:restriction endonuclease subunit S n=1 Tax=Mitsuokella jalaludinii TaxID=187979 RepID=UPI003F9D4E4A
MMKEYTLEDIAPIKQGECPKNDHIWLLNLDMIESDTGDIVGYEYVDFDKIGNSTVSFDTTNVLYSKLRPYLNKVVIPNRPGYATSEIVVLKPNPEIITREYLAYFLRSSHFVKYINSKTTGAKMPRANIKVLKQAKVLCPNLDTQNQIVKILQKCTKIINARKKELMILDELVKARFIEFFGDPVINIYKYPEHMLGENVEFLTSGSRGWAKYYSKKGKMFITIKNVKDGQILTNNIQYITPPDNAEARRTKVQNGDLLISITADLGRTAVVPQEIAEKGAYINQHLMCVRLNKKVLLPEYVSFFMESEAGKRQFYAKNQNAVKAGLNFDAIKTFKIMVPPLEKQNKYISFTKRVNKSKITIDSCIVIIRKALQSGYHYVWGICHDQF